MELDSHADTVVLGNNCVIVSFTGRECDVSPYIESYDSIKGVPIVTGATAWTSDRTGETLILVFHEAIWMGDVMDHSLVNPIQLCHNGVEVQDNPYSLSEMRIASESNDVIIPHTASGTTTHFPSRTPTDRELQTCRHVYLTSQSEWNPHQVRFPEPLQRIKDLDARALKQVRIDPFNLASHAWATCFMRWTIGDREGIKGTSIAMLQRTFYQKTGTQIQLCHQRYKVL